MKKELALADIITEANKHTQPSTQRREKLKKACEVLNVSFEEVKLMIDIVG